MTLNGGVANGGDNPIVDLAVADTLEFEKFSTLSAGTTLASFTLERRYNDLSNEFVNYLGMCPNTMNMGIGTQNILNIGFGFLGKRENSATATLASSTTAATTTDICNGIDDVDRILLNGQTADFLEWNMTLNNNLRTRLKVGTLGAVSIGSGTISATGSFRAYYKSKTIIDKLLNNQRSSILVSIAKVNGSVKDRYAISIPSAKFISAARVAGGINQDVIMDVQWQALLDPVTLSSLRIGRGLGMI